MSSKDLNLSSVTYAGSITLSSAYSPSILTILYTSTVGFLNGDDGAVFINIIGFESCINDTELPAGTGKLLTASIDGTFIRITLFCWAIGWFSVGYWFIGCCIGGWGVIGT